MGCPYSPRVAFCGRCWDKSHRTDSNELTSWKWNPSPPQQIYNNIAMSKNVKMPCKSPLTVGTQSVQAPTPHIHTNIQERMHIYSKMYKVQTSLLPIVLVPGHKGVACLRMPRKRRCLGHTHTLAQWRYTTTSNCINKKALSVSGVTFYLNSPLKGPPPPNQKAKTT